MELPGVADLAGIAAICQCERASEWAPLSGRANPFAFLALDAALRLTMTEQ